MSPFHGACFLASAHEIRELPADIGREVAFAGRSNAGKSSAINAIAQRHRLAFVSKTPGRTQTINFFASGSDRIVDLPGYGYAAVPQRERAHWGVLISTYLQQRNSLKGLILVADCRHKLGVLDQQLLSWISHRGQPVLILLTKVDKLGQAAAAAALAAAEALVRTNYAGVRVQLFSAASGLGVKAAQNVLRAWLDQK
jgi:GTP-binding protein